MRTTMDIPDQLYRRVRAKGAMDGLTLRAITITLYSDWLDGRVKTEKTDEKETVKVSTLPSWAGLCGSSITRHADGPDDMESIRKSIASARRLETV